MCSFLYVTKLPRRAITLAQQIIEEDADFRQRVASQATEDNVGQAGILWLYRPVGWASEFDQLTSSGAESEQESTTDFSDQGAAVGSLTAEYNPAPIDEPVTESSVYAENSMDFVETASVEDQAREIRIFEPLPAPTELATEYAEAADEDWVTNSADSSPLTALDGQYVDDPAEVSSEGDAAVASSLPIQENEPTYLGNVAVSEQPYFPEPETDLSSFSDANGDLRDATEVDYESDAFESELSSLRGLVNRLKDEREQVVTGVEEGQIAELAGGVSFDEDVSGLRSDLESARHELSLAQTELSIARQEREEAQRQQSEALKRQVDLEKELSVTRQDLYSIDQRAAESQTQIIGLQDQLKRSESSAADVDRSKNVLQSQLDSMTSERAQLREERSQLKSERDDLLLRIADVEAKTGGVDVGELTSANRSLTTELEQVTRDLARSTSQIQSLDERLSVATQSADSFKAEKIDLSSRLADAELNLETKTTQYDAARVDNEKLASSVGSLRAERDGLQTQLSELQASLADVLNEQAESRQVLENDRLLKNEIRAERDELLARVNAFEQADEELASRLESITKERDDLIVVRDEVMEERGRLRGEASAAASEREQLLERISALESTQTSLATEVQAERRQREELATRILEFDETSARDKSELARHLEERAELLDSIEVLKQAQSTSSEVKRDRDRLQTELVELQRRTGEDADRATVKITEMSDQMAASENERIAYQREISELKAQLQSVKVDFGELSREAAQLRLAANNPTARVQPVVDSPEPVEQEQPTPEAEPPAEEPVVQEPVVEEPITIAEEAPVDQVDVQPQVDVEAPSEAEAEVSIFSTDVAAEPESSTTDLGFDEPAEEHQMAEVHRTMPISLDEVAKAGGNQSADPTWAPPTESQIEDPWADPAADVSDPDWDRQAAATGAVGVVGLAAAAPEPDELDEVGDLISQAVNQFDSDEPGQNVATEPEQPVADEARSIFAVEDPTEIHQIEGAAEGGDLRRRKIEIPNDILDDEVAVAQYVVSSPDVVLLVDGDAVAKLGWPSLPVAQQRDALVTYLASLSTSSGAAPDVVFDGRIGDDDALPASRAVRIRLSTPPTEPAAALDELVDAYPEQWPIALVTDDQSLTQRAAGRGATVLNNGQLLDLFIGE